MANSGRISKLATNVNPFFLYPLLLLFSFTSYSTKTNKIMLKKTWKGHRKEINLLGPIIPGQIVFAFCFGVCMCVCVCFQRPTQMLFDKFWDPWYWKVCLLMQGQRTKETGLSQFRSSPPPHHASWPWWEGWWKAAGSQAHRHLEAQVQPRALAGLGEGLLWQAQAWRGDSPDSLSRRLNLSLSG